MIDDYVLGGLEPPYMFGALGGPVPTYMYGTLGEGQSVPGIRVIDDETIVEVAND